MATEVAAPSEGCPTIEVSDQKEWAILAIKNGFAALTNEQLEDFIHTVKSATCAYFRIVDNKGSEKSCRIFFMSLNGGFQPFATSTERNQSSEDDSNTLLHISTPGIEKQ